MKQSSHQRRPETQLHLRQPGAQKGEILPISSLLFLRFLSNWRDLLPIMSHAVAEIAQMAERHNTHATEISRALNNYTELSVLLAKYGQLEEVR